MPSSCSRVFAVLFCVLSSPLALLAARPITFLGSDPQRVAGLPVSAAAIGSFGIDGDGTFYYADSDQGRILSVTAAGIESVVATGLSNPKVAVDYAGHVFVADTGHDRILAYSSANTAPAVLAQAAAPFSIAADTHGNVFYLSGDGLYEVSREGRARKVATVDHARLLTPGDASGATDAMLVLAGEPRSGYAAYPYFYTGASGSLGQPIASIQGTGLAAGTIPSGFAADAAGNIFVALPLEGGGYSILKSVPEKHGATVITGTLAGGTRLATDLQRNLYYVDGQGLQKIMTSVVSLGTASLNFDVQFGEPGITHLNFDDPAGVATYANFTGPAASDFSSDGCLDSIFCVSFTPGDLGRRNATMIVTNADGNVVAQIPVIGYGQTQLHTLLETDGSATPVLGPSQLRNPYGIATDPGAYFTNSYAYVTDPGSASVLVTGPNGPRAGGPQLNDIPMAIAVAPASDGTLYIAQKGEGGILKVAPNGYRTRIASELAGAPVATALDDAGELFIADGNHIFRIAIDGTETTLASPESDGGYLAIKSLTADAAGDIYAFFAEGGPHGKGGLLKITPSGRVAALNADVGQANGLAVDNGGALYISDGKRGRVIALNTDGSESLLIAGLKRARGIASFPTGTLTVVDQGRASVLEPALPGNYAFGNVPVGGSRSKTFSLRALGNAMSFGFLFLDLYKDPNYSVNVDNYSIEPGQERTVTVTFHPTTVGEIDEVLADVGYDYDFVDPNPFYYSFTGNGVAPEKQK